MVQRHTPPQPNREDIPSEEREAYDRVVNRQKNYNYEEFERLFPEEHRKESKVAAGAAGDQVDEEDKIQPYMGAMLNSPQIMDHISELGVIYRTCGESDTPDSYSHADREWIDMVLSEELNCWEVYYIHMWDAVAQGIRPEAIKALREGRDEDLTSDELELTKYIRQVVNGTVTPESYQGIEERFGQRGAVEFTAFIGHLLMTIRLIQAFGVDEGHSEEHVNELVDMMVTEKVDLPNSKDRVPSLEHES